MPVLLQCLEDTGPRIEYDSSTGKVKTLSDIPDLATQALSHMARSMPEADMLPPLVTGLNSDSPTIRLGAAHAMAFLPPSATVAAAAAGCLSAQTRPDVTRLLRHVVRRAEVPEVLAAVRQQAEALPDAVKVATCLLYTSPSPRDDR